MIYDNKATSSFVIFEQLELPRSDGLQPRSFLLLVVRPGAPSSVLALSSDARSP